MDRIRGVARIGLAVAVATSLGSCQARKAVEVRPITPGVEINKSRAAIGSPIEITYRFQVAPEAQPLDKDYKIFVHFLDSHDEILFTDDHQPPQPVSSWQPGSTIEYGRTVFIPLYPYLGAVSVRLGLYIPETGERVGFIGDERARGSEVAQITLLDQKENIFLVYKEGWHQLESSTENPAIEWQWTKKEAVCSFKNPKTDSVLYLEADTNVSALESPLQVSIFLGPNEVAKFQIEERDPVLKKIPIPAAALGTEDWVDLRIVNDRSFVPSQLGFGNDIRELGLRVYHLFVGSETGA